METHPTVEEARQMREVQGGLSPAFAPRKLSGIYLVESTSPRLGKQDENPVRLSS